MLISINKGEKMKNTNRKNIGNEQVINKSNFSITTLIDESNDRFRRLKIDTDGNFTVIRPDLIAKITDLKKGEVYTLEADLYICLEEIKTIKRNLTSIIQVVRHRKEKTDFAFNYGVKSIRMLKADNDHLASCDQFKNTKEIDSLLELEKDQNTMGVISNKYDPFLLEKIMKTIKIFTGGSKKNLTTVSIVIKSDRMYYYAKNLALNTELRILVMAVREN